MHSIVDCVFDSFFFVDLSYPGVFPYVLVLAVIGLVITFAMLKLPQAPQKN
ncbi:MAG: hypothetical protein Q8N94_05510 [Methanoregula sp.]|nr:hypothetical protein [Methanoregula sp.]